MRFRRVERPLEGASLDGWLVIFSISMEAKQTQLCRKAFTSEDRPLVCDTPLWTTSCLYSCELTETYADIKTAPRREVS
jgi:hypothetical protein